MIDFPSLRTLTIGNESFKQVTSFTINTLPSLETIDIGDNCFGAIANNIYINSLPELTSLKIGRYSFYDKTSDNRVNCTFQVFNCSQLLLIEIGEYSFGKYEGELKLLSLPALQNLTIGSIENESNNFMYSPKLYLGCIMNYILV